MNHLIRLAAVLLLALSGLTFLSPSTALGQRDECAGIEEYIAALEAAGAELEATMPADDENLDSWTSEEFTEVADMLETAQETFGAIETPAITEEYHAILLEQFGLMAQMFDVMSTAGIFGAFIFIEQMDDIETRANAATQAIEDACGIDIEEIFDDGDTEATPVVEIPAVSDESGDSSTSAATGTREDPIPMGQPVQFGDDWELTVLSVTPDATDLVMSESSFNDPPAEGRQFFIVTLRVTYTGDSSDQFNGWDLRTVGQSAVSYSQWAEDCGRIPDQLSSTELFPGGTIEGNVCWPIAVEDADSLVLYDRSQDNDERIFLSLIPDEAVATPAADRG